MLPEPGQKEPAVLDPIPENARPGCGADGAAKAGVRENKNYRNQICKRRSCKKFSADAGFGRPGGPPTIVCGTMDGFFSGKSAGKIARGLKDETERAPSQRAASNRIGRYSAALGSFAGSLKPRLGDKCRSDGMPVTVRGRQRYLHMTIGSFARFWTAYATAPNKASDDVSCPLGASARAACKIPLPLVADYDRAHHKAWFKTFRFNEDGKRTYRRRHAHARWYIKTERFNWTARLFARPAGRLFAAARKLSRLQPRPPARGDLRDDAGRGGRHRGERAQAEDADPARRAVPEKVLIGQIRRGADLAGAERGRAFFQQRQGAIRDPQILGGSDPAAAGAETPDR